MNAAWECRDQSDQSEEYFNQPLRLENQRLQDENLALKRLLRENGLRWPAGPYSQLQDPPSQASSDLPYLPVEVMLKILSYALTSRHPVMDPLCSSKKENLTTEEQNRSNQIAIHFLATCKTYYVEGKKLMWANNTFVFTSVQAMKAFANVDLVYRQMVKQVSFRIIAQFYDDEEGRIHRLSSEYHPSQSRRLKLPVQKRVKEPTLARRGFRAYAWYQLIDFLEALLPPFDPAIEHHKPRPRLLPNLERLRIDLVNFGEGLFMSPPTHLHDVAAHQLGCALNELVIAGLPIDDTGFRARTELCGMLRDDGLLIDHAPTLVAQKNGLQPLAGHHIHYKVVRAMRPSRGITHHHHDDRPNFFDEFPPAPKDEGIPPFSENASCRTIWKKVPECIGRLDNRNWVLFDRVSGLPWDDVEEEITMLDFSGDSEDEDMAMVCENCGEVHPGSIPPDELLDEMYDDDP
ncbi:uncharacterized protein BCR38DRAFT_353677 [Pseudomassariella vexata]|uniref:Uncharacterized protein n=1 Tax=Pseudomassariella vexata TaxID=1141098 RepID=A0A1Y2DFK0_9PEZI|nr:uncharacterized protein BCR38DRAFT_353677 [Pseudomassariella vexata]ORY58052.1 hypothetical protein BCR38DRAFT_353677 [Pseudomassariella vexata]